MSLTGTFFDKLIIAMLAAWLSRASDGFFSVVLVVLCIVNFIMAVLTAYLIWQDR